MLLALKLGAVPISVTDVLLDLGRVVLGQRGQLSTEYRLIVFELRLPQILLGIMVGAALSVAGAGFQALLRNPLADPYVLGVSSGAALGAILSLIASPHVPLATPLAAFAGAGLTIAAVYFLGRREGQLDSGTLLLAGIIAASFLSAVIMFLMTTLPGRQFPRKALLPNCGLSTPLAPGIRWVFVVGLLAPTPAIFNPPADP